MQNDQEIFRAYRFDKPLSVTVTVLLTFGIIMVFSSSGILSGEHHNHPFHYFFHQLIGAGLGILMLVVMLRIKKPFYKSQLVIYGLVLSTLFLLLLCLAMPPSNGTRRWVYFMNFRFQPSELAKISLVLFLAYVLSRNKESRAGAKQLVLPLLIVFLMVFLILLEPDYSTAALLFFIAVIMLFIGGVKLKYFFIPGILSLSLFSVYLFKADYRIGRIFAFLSPEKDPLGSGFHIIQSKLAVGSGGIFRLNIGESIQKLFFLPCAHTDYIFAIVGEEFGLVGAMAILMLFSVLLWRGLKISWAAPSKFDQIAAAGLTLAIFTQALVNISVVLGVGPPTGLPLPLFSYGRSSLVCTLFCVGILLHISERKIQKEQG
jgi:cell division protein FtsW